MKKINNNLIVSSLSLLVISIFTLTAIIPTEAKANAPMQLSNGINTYSGNQNYIDNTPTQNPYPVIYSITPVSAEVCSGAKNITIDGKNFVPSSVARWNGSSRATTYVNSNELIISTNNNDICSASGNYPITVYNPAPGGGISNTASFTLRSASTNSVKTVAKTSKTKTVAKATTAKDVQVACATGTNPNDNSNLTANALFGSNNFMPSNIFQWLLLFIIILLIVILTRKILAKDEPLKHE